MSSVNFKKRIFVKLLTWKNGVCILLIRCPRGAGADGKVTKIIKTMDRKLELKRFLEFLDKATREDILVSPLKQEGQTSQNQFQIHLFI